MKKFLPILWLLFFVITSKHCYSQYSISGYLDAAYKNKRVYLSLLQYNEERAIAKRQIVTTTLVDSTGYFSFTGKLLSNKHKLYRIHTNVDESSPGLDFSDTEEIKNFHNFIFSNVDTIVFNKPQKPDLGGQWFFPSVNTNLVDKQWREMRNYKQKLRKEFTATKNPEAKLQSTAQFLSELKAYFNKTKTHPLLKLIALSEIQEKRLKRDFENDAEFYFGLQNELNSYFSRTSYASQFEDLISKLSLAQTKRQLAFYKQTTYLLSVIVLALILAVLFLAIKTKRKKQPPVNEAISLTNQEEKIAKLIMQEKSNKEIASELFISLSTVKTHIRNLYAKFEVNNRHQFTTKIKNQPRD